MERFAFLLELGLDVPQLFGESADFAVPLSYLITNVLLVFFEVLTEASDLCQKLVALDLQLLTILLHVDQPAGSIHHQLRHLISLQRKLLFSFCTFRYLFSQLLRFFLRSIQLSL